MADFPVGSDVPVNTTDTEVLSTASGIGMSPLLNKLLGLGRALIAKIGTGASTPTANKVLRATGTGTSAWGQVVGTDITAQTILGGVSGAASNIAPFTIAGGTAGANSNLQPATIAAGDIAAGATRLKIGEVSGTGASGVLEISSIPGTYRNITASIVGRSDTAATNASVRLTFETSPTAGAYDYQLTQTGNTTVAGVEALGTSDYIFAGYVPGATSTASLYGGLMIHVLEYANTGFWKIVKCLAAGATTLTSGNILDFSSTGAFESAAAITRVRATLSAGNWTTASRMTLYGDPA